MEGGRLLPIRLVPFVGRVSFTAVVHAVRLHLLHLLNVGGLGINDSPGDTQPFYPGLGLPPGSSCS